MPSLGKGTNQNYLQAQKKKKGPIVRLFKFPGLVVYKGHLGPKEGSTQKPKFRLKFLHRTPSTGRF